MNSRLLGGIAFIVLGVGYCLHSRNLVALYYVLRLAGLYHGHGYHF